MTFTLEINCDNAAFGDNKYDAGLEVARILKQVADKLEGGHKGDTVRDINGNLVGSFILL